MVPRLEQAQGSREVHDGLWDIGKRMMEMMCQMTATMMTGDGLVVSMDRWMKVLRDCPLDDRATKKIGKKKYPEGHREHAPDFDAR